MSMLPTCRFPGGCTQQSIQLTLPYCQQHIVLICMMPGCHNKIALQGCMVCMDHHEPHANPAGCCICTIGCPYIHPLEQSSPLFLPLHLLRSVSDDTLPPTTITTNLNSNNNRKRKSISEFIPPPHQPGPDDEAGLLAYYEWGVNPTSPTSPTTNTTTDSLYGNEEDEDNDN